MVSYKKVIIYTVKTLKHNANFLIGLIFIYTMIVTLISMGKFDPFALLPGGTYLTEARDLMLTGKPELKQAFISILNGVILLTMQLSLIRISLDLYSKKNSNYLTYIKIKFSLKDTII